MVKAEGEMDAPGAAPRDLGNAQRLRAILGGSAGNLVEWFDWFAYASFTLYFAKVFFPKGDETALMALACAIAIAMRDTQANSAILED
jgi:MHS family alpha-ketoglutarate permease-like MFS transporter